MSHYWTWMSALTLAVPVYIFCTVGQCTARAGLGAAAIGWGVMCVILTILDGGHPLSPPMTGDGFVASGALVLLGASLCVGWRAWLAVLAGIYMVGPGVVAALGYGGGYAQHVQDAVGVTWIGILGIGGLASYGAGPSSAAGGAAGADSLSGIGKYL